LAFANSDERQGALRKCAFNAGRVSRERYL
jgi:hypothetical protein